LAVRFPHLGGIYFLFNGAFVREYRACLAAQLAERLQADNPASDSRRHHLRRNIHRMEKGLIARPQRDVFARDYIDITVESFDCLVRASTDSDADRRLLGWSHDVLRTYFDLPGIKACESLRPLAERFEQACEIWNTPLAGWAPKPRTDAPPPIDYEQMLRLAQRRRSVRWYADRPVPREMIDKAIEIAGYSPSACNRQPFEFRVFDDPSLVRKVAGIPGGTRGFAQNFPCVIVVVGKMAATPLTHDRHIIYIDASLATMSLLFALESQGLGSCCINWLDRGRLEREMGRTLSLKPDERVIMLVALGWPDPEGLVPYSKKKSLDELRRYN
jgi:nitroreductase